MCMYLLHMVKGKSHHKGVCTRYIKSYISRHTDTHTLVVYKTCWNLFFFFFLIHVQSASWMSTER